MCYQHEKALRVLESPLDYPGLAPHPHPYVSLRVWRYPSFQPWSSWTLIEVSEEMFLRRVTWDQSQELVVDPVTYGSEVPVALPVIEPLLSQLRTIKIAPFISVPIVGVDGTSYGIEIGSFSISAHLSWWETPPPGWAALHNWHAKAVGFFESLLPASTPTVAQGET